MVNERRIVWFSGTVQGVGFRFTACRIARGYDVTGRVRNLPDGRVQCIVEGAAGQIDAFLAELGQQMSGYIRHREQETCECSGEYGEFTYQL